MCTKTIVCVATIIWICLYVNTESQLVPSLNLYSTQAFAKTPLGAIREQLPLNLNSKRNAAVTETNG